MTTTFFYRPRSCMHFPSDMHFPSHSTSSDGLKSIPSRSCCFVVEYLSGGTMQKYLIRNRRKKLVIKVVIQLALDLARGLSYLHSKKTVHRDVKTENMLQCRLRYLHSNVKIAGFWSSSCRGYEPKRHEWRNWYSWVHGSRGTHAVLILQSLMESLTIGNVMSLVLAYACGKFTVVACLILILALLKCHLQSALDHQNLRPEMPRCCPNSLANITKNAGMQTPISGMIEMSQLARINSELRPQSRSFG